MLAHPRFPKTGESHFYDWNGLEQAARQTHTSDITCMQDDKFRYLEENRVFMRCSTVRVAPLDRTAPHGQLYCRRRIEKCYTTNAVFLILYNEGEPSRTSVRFVSLF
jgi:hypothetical protein